MGSTSETDRFQLVTFRGIESPEDFGPLSATVLDLARTTFGHIESEERIRSHLHADVAVIAVDADTRRALGLTLLRFRTVATLDETRRQPLAHLDQHSPIAYLHGSAILPEAQGSGLYRRLNRMRVEAVIGERIVSVLTTTQNPKVERGLTRLFDELHDEGLITHWQLDRSIIPGMYGQLLTPHQPSADGTPFATLDRDAGDAFSLLFSLTYPELDPAGALRPERGTPPG